MLPAGAVGGEDGGRIEEDDEEGPAEGEEEGGERGTSGEDVSGGEEVDAVWDGETGRGRHGDALRGEEAAEASERASTSGTGGVRDSDEERK